MPADIPSFPVAKAGGAQSVDRALALLAAVARSGASGGTLADLAAAADMAKPTARRLLISLIAAHLVEQDDATRTYHLGAGAWLLGMRAGLRHDMTALAADAVARLARDSGDSAFLLIPQGDDVLCLLRKEGSHPIRTHALLEGDRNPLGVGAGGLALLAALPEAEAAETLTRLGPALISRMGEDAAAHVPADVAHARMAGFAVNPGRVIAGSWGIGAAIRWPDGRPAAALSIAAIENRLGPFRQEDLSRLLLTEAAHIETRLARHLTPGAVAPEAKG